MFHPTLVFLYLLIFFIYNSTADNRNVWRKCEFDDTSMEIGRGGLNPWDHFKYRVFGAGAAPKYEELVIP
jgi:hypothetical protein